MDSAGAVAEEQPWKGPAIWLLPVFGGILGGIAAAMLTYDRDPRQAARLFLVGVVVTLALVLAINRYGLPGRY